MTKIHKIMLGVSSFLSFVAVLNWPYDYYVILRVVIFITAIYVGSYFFKKKNDLGEIIYGIIIVLFNPLFIIHLTREVWFPINIIVGVILFITAVKFND